MESDDILIERLDNLNLKTENTLDELLQSNKINKTTYDKVKTAQAYIERKIKRIEIQQMEKDLINKMMLKARLSEQDRAEIERTLSAKEHEDRLKKIKVMTIYDYDYIKSLGKGSFGEVSLCRNRQTGELVAIKKMPKQLIIDKGGFQYIKNEQSILAQTNSQWIANLRASFQEGDFLFLVLEFCPGGDLYNYLCKRDEQDSPFTPQELRFYIAELVEALGEVHSHCGIHRDIKPENILLDQEGHLKITDFGLAIPPEDIFREDILKLKMDEIEGKDEEKEEEKNEDNTKEEKKRRKRHLTCLGTPYYIAPEMLLNKGYDKKIDWWAMGVVIYELVYGDTPFSDDDAQKIFNKIVRYKNTLKFPNHELMTDDLKDLIKKFICKAEDRWDNIEEIRKHPYFKGIRWNLRKFVAPYIPEEKNYQPEDPGDFYPDKRKKPKDSEFIGYTFKGAQLDDDKLEKAMQLISLKEQEMKKKKTG